MPEHSDIHGFTEWAKSRLDEMDAAIASMEKQMGAFKEKSRQQAAPALAEAQKWRDEFRTRVKDVQEQGESRIAGAMKNLNSAWAGFELDVQRWAGASEHHCETISARAQALTAAWHATAQRYRAQAAGAAEAQNQNLAAAVEKLEKDAAEQRAELAKLQKVGVMSWSAMGKALKESRDAFETASKTIRNQFDSALKR